MANRSDDLVETAAAGAVALATVLGLALLVGKLLSRRTGVIFPPGQEPPLPQEGGGS